MHIIGQIFWILAVWRWGDWRNWEKYHSTMLYMIAISLLYDVLSYRHTLWEFKDFWLPTHTWNSIVVTFIGFPCSVLIYLSRFPQNSIIKQIGHIIYWILIYSAIELFFILINLFDYHNGWNFGLSVLFNCVLFPMLLLHHKKPLLAYLLTVPIIICFLLIFDIPISKVK